MIQVIPELMEVGGHKKIKITVRDGEKVIDADTVNPLNSRERKKVSRRLAESAGDMQQVERIEQVLLDSIDLMKEEDEGSGFGGGASEKEEVVADGVKLARAELIVTG